MHRFHGISHLDPRDLEMTFQCHRRSNLIAPLDSLHMVSYLLSMQSEGLTCTIEWNKPI